MTEPRLKEIDYIRDDLAITSIAGVRENDTSDFDKVLSVCQDMARDNVGTEYTCVKLADDIRSKQRWGGTTEYAAFERAADRVLGSLLTYDESILVHCHSGQNRSAAVCTAALGVAEKVFYIDAGEMVYEARPVININQLMAAHARRYIDEKKPRST